ncbi:collagen triple helix repeat-containing protein 1-like [Clytia hemisphaerica]|uniref:CTHRC1 C-terminal domain-containing protein n=1 Tax=Clytia hemisphaerica TaxID=252671 RepID=A0A7M5VG73_9CNID
MRQIILVITLLAILTLTQAMMKGSSAHGFNNYCGKDGRDGRDGKDGKDGIGKDGKDGRDGRNGINGKDGVNGKDGKNGKDGTAAKKNWKECAWYNIADDKDHGVVKSCSFKKNSTSTYMKVVVSSGMRITNCNQCCKRWFVTFDGHECAPVPIDGIVYMHEGTGNRYKNQHRPQVITGHCKISKSNIINVALNVGNCNGYGNVDAQTGWNSATRIQIEEVDEPQH